MRILNGSRYTVLNRVDTPEGSAFFKGLQGITWHEYIVEQQVFCVNYVRPNLFRFVVFTDEDGEDVYHVLVLDDREHLMVLSDGRRGDEGHIFTSEPRSFIRLVRDCEIQATLVTQDSPFDLNPDETDNYDEVIALVVEKVNKLLTSAGIAHIATPDNVLCVSQL